MSPFAVAGFVALAAGIGVGVSGLPSSGGDDSVRIDLARARAPRSSTSTPAASAGGRSTTPSTTSTLNPSTPSATSGTSTSTVARPAVRTPEELTVLVGNGAGVRGVGAALTLELGVAGYGTLDAVDANSPHATTVVYFPAGSEREAAALAVAIGIPPERIAVLPDPLPVDDLAGADLLVVIGTDRAA